MAIKAQINEKSFSIGDIIRIHYLIKERGKERTQAYDGQVIGIKGRNENKTFTVRKIACDKIGTERIFPLNSPWIKDLEVIRHPKVKVKRAKLYFTRNPRAKKV